MSFSITTISVIFWTSVLLLLQTFFLYPLELMAWHLLSASEGGQVGDRPSVTLVIAAYNEEEVIEDKIRNSLELSYPDLNIVVFSDASDDRTDEIVRSFSEEGVVLQRIEGRVGKTACQNRVVESVSTDVVVFSDANSMYKPDAIKRLVERFEEGVGCVVGELRYDGGGVGGESLYWRYERLIKRLESSFHNLVTGNGAIYAVRTSSYVPLPNDAISDFAEPLAIVRNGEVVKYAPDAIATEHTEQSVTSELSRRERIVTRSWHTFLDNRDLANPLQYPKFSFQLFSHKVLRWLAPIFLVVGFVTNVILAIWANPRVYDWLLICQSVFYLSATVGTILTRLNLEVPFMFHVPQYFVVSNYGMLHGLFTYLREGTIVSWETTERAENQ